MKAERPRTGRPIGFDKEAALEAAMLLFWQKGFEGAALSDLTEAMGLSASSIYAAYGDKQTLFSLAVDRYLQTRAQYASEALAKTTLPAVVRALFTSTVAFLTGPDHPPTCMTLGGAMGCSTGAAPARDLMTAVRRENEVAMKQRFLQAQKAGELPNGTDAGDYTRLLSMMLAGLSIQAANGASDAELKRLAKLAIAHLGFSSAKS